jgi:hypothetical protein
VVEEEAEEEEEEEEQQQQQEGDTTTTTTTTTTYLRKECGAAHLAAAAAHWKRNQPPRWLRAATVTAAATAKAAWRGGRKATATQRARKGGFEKAEEVGKKVVLGSWGPPIGRQALALGPEPEPWRCCEEEEETSGRSSHDCTGPKRRMAAR